MKTDKSPAGDLDHKAKGWLEQIRSEIRPRDSLSLDPENCALFIIDMNNYFAGREGRCFLPDTVGIIPNIRKLLALWRGKKGTVVFTRHGHSGPDDLGMLGKFFNDYIHEDERDADIVLPLTPGDMEHVVHKKTYDAFLGTGLDDYLRRNSITQVLITGVLTHMCCETTARAAFCRGFEVFIPVDATASSNETVHVSALKNMASCVCVPVGTREVLEKWGE